MAFTLALSANRATFVRWMQPDSQVLKNRSKARFPIGGYFSITLRNFQTGVFFKTESKNLADATKVRQGGLNVVRERGYLQCLPYCFCKRRTDSGLHH
jgi:hypothetical protein